MPRSGEQVWDELLSLLGHTVRQYHPSVVPLPLTRTELIQGTAFFPGGSGTWRGTAPFDALPRYFPDRPVMFVAHNFDKAAGFLRSRMRGGEATGAFWQRLISLCEKANLPLSDCFFTNALMGLQPERATGPMPSTPAYLAQSDRFLQEQLRVTEPRLVVTLGNPAYLRVASLNSGLPLVRLQHPSALTYVRGGEREAWLAEEARRLRSALALLPLDGARRL